MSHLTPWQHYQADLQRDDFSYDPAQEQAVKALQRVYDELIAAQQKPTGMAKLLGFLAKPAPSVQGLYLWGGVGRGTHSSSWGS